MKLVSFSSIDWLLMISVFVVVAFSLVTLFTIDPSLFRSQLTFFIISIVAFLFFSQINPSIFRYYAIPIYIASLIVLTLVLFLGIESRGSTRWFELAGFRIQFSEIFKPFLAVSLATYLTNLRSFSFRSFITAGAFSAIPAILIFLQPDLGTALIYVFVLASVLLIYGFPFRYFIFGFAMWLLSLPDAIKDALVAGVITEGHVRPLISLGDSKLMLELFKKILKDNSTVRQTEDMARQVKGETEQREPRKTDKLWVPELDEMAKTVKQTQAADKAKIDQSRSAARIILEKKGDVDITGPWVQQVVKLLTQASQASQ